MKLFRTKYQQAYIGYYPKKNGRKKTKFFEFFSLEFGTYRAWWVGNICFELAPRE